MDVLVYKDGGPHQRAGGSYDYRLAVTEQVFLDAINSGWFASLPEAIDGSQLIHPDAPPTRNELELKASELGIDFDGRTSDKKLAAKIEEALGA